MDIPSNFRGISWRLDVDHVIKDSLFSFPTYFIQLNMDSKRSETLIIHNVDSLLDALTSVGKKNEFPNELMRLIAQFTTEFEIPDFERICCRSQEKMVLKGGCGKWTRIRSFLWSPKYVCDECLKHVRTCTDCKLQTDDDIPFHCHWCDQDVCEDCWDRNCRICTDPGLRDMGDMTHAWILCYQCMIAQTRMKKQYGHFFDEMNDELRAELIPEPVLLPLNELKERIRLYSSSTLSPSTESSNLALVI